MERHEDSLDLGGKLLLAMPGMADPRFGTSVVYVCAHSEDGAMGLVVNKPAAEISFSNLLEQLEIETGPEGREIAVHMGGPVENGRGFVLHSADYASEQSTLQVDQRFGMTATLDILESIAQGTGPHSSLLALGYAGWGPGQIEEEIAQNGWLIAEAAPEIVFAEDSSTKWRDALATLGIDPITLSASAGRA